ncbi:lysophospholipid acyltransferase family protein [Halomicronema hongdechloris]
MELDHPLALSQGLLTALGVHQSLHFCDRIPTASSSILVVSNHRSILDAPLLMTGLNRPVRFACHHYMSQVPLMRELVTTMGGFPLAAAGQRPTTFLRQAHQFLQRQQAVGIFPEGALPMVQSTQPQQLTTFQRGFAHLALRAPVDPLVILPVAIAATDEISHSAFPLKLLSWFDPSEPLFDQPGWHPFVLYRQVSLLIGHPIQITAAHRHQYRGQQAGTLASELTDQCRTSIADLLQHGCY